MSTIKTIVNSSAVLSFLQKRLDSSIQGINFIKGGEQAQAFSFVSKQKDLIIRINRKLYSFDKDNYAFKHFGSKNLPIPEILDIGKFDRKHYYAISSFAPGQTLDTVDKETKLQLLPQILSIHDEIRNTRIEKGNFGDWDKNGIARFKSWKKFISGKRDSVYKNWQKLYNTTFLEKEPVEKITETIEKLLDFLPEESYLIHGDYGGNNMTTTGGKITGVLDWGESKYGDFIFDVAWIDFFSGGELPYANLFKKHYEEIGLRVGNFNERLLCYKMHLGLGSIGFFALSGQKDVYEWTKKGLLKLMEESKI
ncbi:MAG: aminoglycoside phosphotransferase family protein [Candidatus Levyibacteriota bacterium]